MDKKINNLKKIMFEKGISSYRLSKMTGLSAYNIRHLCEGDNLERARQSTLEIMADALGVKADDIRKRDRDVDKLEKGIRDKANELARMLRAYTGESFSLKVYIFGREDDSQVKTDTDYFDVTVTISGEEGYAINESGLMVRDGKGNLKAFRWFNYEVGEE